MLAAVAAGGRFCGLKAALLSPSLNGYEFVGRRGVGVNLIFQI